ncbi:hypothetical protein [Desulfotomaculum copahuensis]|uniref:DinB/UmuC family translesion DNA polymerase n=1 Tax=Desulfotomaculum copahuensis TaxID=1838280 RepID=UPI000B2F2BD8
MSLGERGNHDCTIYRAARELFLVNCGRPPWRLIGVQVSNLDDGACEQLSLFREPDRDGQVCRVVDELREKFGRDVVKRAISNRPFADNPTPHLPPPE